MWIFYPLAFAIGTIVGHWVWRATPVTPAPTPGQLPPPAPPLGADATSFATKVLNGSPVATFLPQTRAAMVAVLRANGWVVREMKSAAISTVGPPVAAGSMNAFAAIQAALISGLNVFADADMPLKISGSAAAPPAASSPVFIAIATGLPSPEPASDNETVATTPQQAVEALSPTFPASRFVLFAAAGEVL